jgi:anti-anti-sigma regulatory factor
MSAAKGTMTLINVSPEVYGIFDVTGLSKIISIKRKMREISIEGLKFM